MNLPDIRRLAAVDMHGAAGTTLRRWLIIIEFFAGAAGGLGLGIWVAISGGSAGSQAFGALMAGLGVNYAVLAWQTVILSKPGALAAELAGKDVLRELRYYGFRQFWVVVPFLFAVLAVRQRRGSSAASSPEHHG